MYSRKLNARNVLSLSTIRRHGRGLWLALIAGGLSVAAFAAFPQDEGDRPFDPRLDPGFGDASVPLREFLRDRHVRARAPQHFCIAGYQNGGEKRAWVHWQEGKKIILWLGATNPVGAKTSIARSRRVLDLRHDVVPTAVDLKGSTYLVTRQWADHVLADCEARGDKYEISVKGK
jgi:hypothetical protein